MDPRRRVERRRFARVKSLARTADKRWGRRWDSLFDQADCAKGIARKHANGIRIERVGRESRYCPEELRSAWMYNTRHVRLEAERGGTIGSNRVGAGRLEKNDSRSFPRGIRLNP